jgi:hypothetical protein
MTEIPDIITIIVTGKPLFIAPIDLQDDDEVALLFGKPIQIKRDGVEIWRDTSMPKIYVDLLLEQV